LTGRLPFVGPSSMDLMLAHATEMPPRFHDLGLPIDLPEPIEACVMTCLEKNPTDRPQSASELAEMYQMALSMVQSGMGATNISQTPQVAAPKLINDPNALSFTMEAWMPESIAIVKLRGFAHDHDGQIIDSQPGLVRMKLGPNSLRNRKSMAPLGWLSFNRKIDLHVELHLHSVDPRSGTKLLIQALFRPQSLHQLSEASWRERCTQAYIDLRGYLMGTSD
jgi:eukaryotic-like serine/threonine-protein kinase